jgi:hypothetical protein
MKNKLTSIQVSVDHRDKLKKYCDDSGHNMNKFVENLIDGNVVENKNELKTIKFKCGTKEEILRYLRTKTNGDTYVQREKTNINDPSLYIAKESQDLLQEEHPRIEEGLLEDTTALFEDQIDNSIGAGSPICSVSMWKTFKAEGHRKWHSDILVRETFFITNFSELKAEMELSENKEARKKEFQQWLNEELVNNPEINGKLLKLAGVLPSK